MLTATLFAPQILAYGLNTIIFGFEIFAQVVMSIPAVISFIIAYVLYLVLFVLDAMLEFVYDLIIGQLAGVLSLGTYNPWKTDDIPNISSGAKQIMYQARSWIGTRPYFGRITVPTRSFAQQIVDMIANIGVSEPIAFLILFAFIAILWVGGIFLMIKMR
ncbi:MAG: hypothetical protein Q6351_004800 [Candidatus Njordarchaeum guaymaensis]